jgi:hypothetical protein
MDIKEILRLMAATDCPELPAASQLYLLYADTLEKISDHIDAKDLYQLIAIGVCMKHMGQEYESAAYDAAEVLQAFLRIRSSR